MQVYRAKIPKFLVPHAVAAMLRRTEKFRSRDVSEVRPYRDVRIVPENGAVKCNHAKVRKRIGHQRSHGEGRNRVPVGKPNRAGARHES